MTNPPDLVGVRHDYLVVGGVRTHVALAGPDDAPAVILVHGWPQNWWEWREVIPALAGRFRVIAPDLRGHGWTQAPDGGYDKEQLASDLLALLDALDVPQVTWVGHDWGGWTGFLAALRAPTRIGRMLALCIPHPWTAPDPWQLLTLLSYQVPLSSPILGARVARTMARAILQSGRGGDRLTAEDVSLFADHIPDQVSVAMYRTFLTREMVPIARGRYADSVLTVPTTLLLGANDPVTKRVVPGPVDSQPQLHVTKLDGVAHWVPEQRPSAIVDWINQTS